MHDRVVITPEFRPLFTNLGLTTAKAITRRLGSCQETPKNSVSIRQDVLAAPERPPVAVYFKQYAFESPSWRFIGRPSKAACEYRNYLTFQRLGIQSAEPIAWGERRDAIGRLSSAFIVTRAIPGAMTLIDFLPAHCPDPSLPAAARMRASLVRQVAEMTRRIHDAGFFHRDLVWRNILVTWQAPGEPQAWWIDCPRGMVSRSPLFRRHRWIKDLASLDKRASQHCTRRERLMFVMRYLETARLGPQGKALIRDVLRYRKRRWPEDWR